MRRFGGEGNGSVTGGWQRQQPPALLNEGRDEGRSVVRRLFRRVRRDGAEVEATLWWNSSLGQACVEIDVRSFAAADTLAESLAKGVLDTLDAEGAREPTE
jgi:hypothetical protein